MMEYASNGNGSDPTAFAAHAKKKKHDGPRNQNHGRAGPKGRKGRYYTCNRQVTMQESALIEGTLPGMMTTTTREGMVGTTGSKEKGRLPLIVVEMGNLSRGQEIPDTMSLMLLIIREMNLFLYLPSLLHLLPTPWMSS